MRAIIPALWLLLSTAAIAQTDGPLIVSWPSNDKPILKLTFSIFRKTGIVNGEGIFVSDVLAQNVSDQAIPRSVFTVFISDKDGVRIGRARMQLAEIPPYRSLNAQVQFSAPGAPARVALLAGKTIPLQIISVPAGANFKVDGEESGVTPKTVDFTIGTHTVEFSKQGYANGSTSLEVGADELPGGSVTFELGGLSQDAVELRDGTTLLGDVLSMSLTAVVVRINGKDQKYDRNQIKKIMLVERITTPQAPVTQGEPGKPKK